MNYLEEKKVYYKHKNINYITKLSYLYVYCDFEKFSIR